MAFMEIATTAAGLTMGVALGIVGVVTVVYLAFLFLLFVHYVVIHKFSGFREWLDSDGQS